MNRGSMNVRAAFVHNLVDVFGSVAVLIGAGFVYWLNWNWGDPLITLGIAGYVIYQVVKTFPGTVQLLMEGTPAGMDLKDVVVSPSLTAKTVTNNKTHNQT